MRKPTDLAYGVAERPPWTLTALLALQHVGLMSVFLLFPLVIAREAAAPATALADMLRLGMVALAAATALQAARLGPFGSGFLCPAVFTAAYLGPSVAAARVGGLPLVFGMTVSAGVIEVALSRFLHRLRALLPTEISGLVVFLVGLHNATIGARYLLVPEDNPVPAAAGWAVGGVCLAVSVALNVWTRGAPRNLCLLIGMAAGYVAALYLDVVPRAHLPSPVGLAAVALPGTGHLAWRFDPAFLPPFAVAAVAALLKAVAVVTMCQRMSDADWLRPNLTSIARGVAADGAGTAVAGLLGAVGVNCSSPNVGLAAATGVASRVVAFAISLAFLVLASMPAIAGLLTTLPRPLIGAGLLFSTCFVLLNGMQIMTSRMLDVRKSLVIGLSIVVALSVELMPPVGEDAPAWAQPILGSSLVLGTLVALLLNLLFRLGVRQRRRLMIDPAAFDPEELRDFMTQSGARWAARPEVVLRATFAANQLVETLIEHGGVRGPIAVTVTFDEFRLGIEALYTGPPLELPERRPSDVEILAGDDGSRRLAGFMLRRNADRVDADRVGHQSVMRFGFEH